MVDKYCQFSFLYAGPSIAAKLPQVHGDGIAEAVPWFFIPENAWIEQ